MGEWKIASNMRIGIGRIVSLLSDEECCIAESHIIIYRMIESMIHETTLGFHRSV